MTDHLTRRDFVTAASALAGAALLPAAATAGRAPVGTAEDYEHQYTALLDDTRRALPRTRLIVLEPFVLRCGAVDDRWFPEFDQRRAAAERVAGRAGAAFVPLQRVFNDLARRSTPQYWAADGVHPTPAGHAAIAEQWRRAAKL